MQATLQTHVARAPPRTSLPPQRVPVTVRAKSPAPQTPAATRAVRHSMLRRSAGGATQAVTTGAPRGPTVSDLLGAASAFLKALGFSAAPQAIKAYFGAVGGGAGGGAGAGKLAQAMAEYAFFPSRFPGVACSQCMSCTFGRVMGALKPLQVPINKAVTAFERAVRLVDAAMYAAMGVSLSEWLQALIVQKGNASLAKQESFLKYVRLRWGLPVGAAVASMFPRATKSVRLYLLRWLLNTFVDEKYPLAQFLPPRIRARDDKVTHNFRVVEAALFGPYKHTTALFLRGAPVDLAPVLGYLVRHVLELNVFYLKHNAPFLACNMCASRTMGCKRPPQQGKRGRGLRGRRRTKPSKNPPVAEQPQTRPTRTRRHERGRRWMAGARRSVRLI